MTPCTSRGFASAVRRPIRFPTISAPSAGVPGLYPGRTRHIHVKVQAPRQPVLTTQLYFPDERRNDRDRIFDSELLMRITDGRTAREGRFDFVLDLA